MTDTTQQNNFCLDYPKGVTCVFGVFMHCGFLGVMGIGCCFETRMASVEL